MTVSIAILLFILAITLVLFSVEWVPVDVVALGILLTLILTGLLPVDKAFAGFGSDTVMLILGLLILTAALVRTGAVEIFGRYLSEKTGSSPNRVLGIVMVASAGLTPL
jgi:di/tricarboxylate transporter